MDIITNKLTGNCIIVYVPYHIWVSCNQFNAIDYYACTNVLITIFAQTRVQVSGAGVNLGVGYLKLKNIGCAHMYLDLDTSIRGIRYNSSFKIYFS